MAIAIDKRDREYAKNNGEALFQVMIDLRYVPEELKEKYKTYYKTYSESGAMKIEDAIKLRKLFLKRK